ncbi:hypothetical protein [Bacillus smithii]|uniref:hypothetical protein n=1 Tax=Bacillus smithii TaxID=1479 RepID=UPI0030C910F6
MKGRFFAPGYVKFYGDDLETGETPAGKATQARPRSERRARRFADRPRKASEFHDHQQCPI